MNRSDIGWFLHTGHETKRWTDRRTETESGQAVIKDKRKDSVIFVVFAPGGGYCFKYVSILSVLVNEKRLSF